MFLGRLARGAAMGGGALGAFGVLVGVACGPEQAPLVAPTATVSATVSATQTTSAATPAPPPFEQPPTCSADGYCWESPLPITGAFTAVWALDERNVYAVGQGRIARFDGASWRAEPSQTAEPSCIWGNAQADVYTAGMGEVQVRKGGVWTKTALTPEVYLHGGWAADSSNVYTVGDDGSIFRFDGKSWAQEPSGTKASLQAIWGSGPSDVYTVGTLSDAGVVLHRDASGWKALPSVGTSLLGVWGSGPNNVWVAGTTTGDKAAVWRWSGSQWNVEGEWSDIEPVGFSGGAGAPQLLAVRWVDRERLRFGPAEVQVLTPTGGKWSARVVYTAPRTALGGGSWAFWGSPDGSAYVAGAWGVFGKYTSSGFQDMLGNVAPGKNLTAVSGTSATDVYAGGDGVLLHYDGKRWSADPVAKDVSVTSMAASKGVVVAAALAGKMLVRRDAAWKQLTTGTKKDLFAVWIQGDDVFAGGAEGTIVRCKNDKCAPMKTSITEDILAISATAAGGVYAAGAQATLLRFDGKSWTVEPTPGYPDVKVVNPANDNKPPYHEGVLHLSAIHPAPRSGMLVERSDGSWLFDNGTWTLLAHGGTLALGGEAGRDVYALYGGQFVQPPLRIRRFDGEKWSEESLPTEAFDAAGLSMRDIWAVGDEVFLVGDGGAIIHRKARSN